MEIQIFKGVLPSHTLQMSGEFREGSIAPLPPKYTPLKICVFIKNVKEYFSKFFLPFVFFDWLDLIKHEFGNMNIILYPLYSVIIICNEVWVVRGRSNLSKQTRLIQSCNNFFIIYEAWWIKLQASVATKLFFN